MTTLHALVSRHRPSVMTALCGLAVAGVVATGCATQGSAEAAPDSGAPMLVEVSDQFVTVHNRTGSALVNVSIVLLQAQGSPFTKIVPRVENQQRQQIALKDLRTTQGASFSPTFARPLKVLVSAANVSGERFEADVPWK